jgi:hypothetical protein
MVGVLTVGAFTVEVFTEGGFTPEVFTTGTFSADEEFGGMDLGTAACSVVIIPDTTHMGNAT